MGTSESEGTDDLAWTRRQVLILGGPVVSAMLALIGCRQQLPPAERRRPSGSTGETDAGAPGEGPDGKTDVDLTDEPDAARPDLGFDAEAGPSPSAFSDWSAVREQFDVDPELVHMAGMLLATHPASVRQAIDRHRRGLDENPNDYLFANWARTREQLDEDAEQRAMEGAARHLEMQPANIALTGNTTEGLATIYHGLAVREDQEMLSGYWNHWASEGSLDYRSQKTGVDRRSVELPAPLEEVTRRQLVDHLADQIADDTRVVASTWVHSNTGLKLPIGEIGRRIEAINRERGPDDRILFCVDGVHGFGVEDAVMEDLHCDFFIAGCHKWLFGPRGTGLVAASPDAWQHATPTIPTFSMSITQGRRFTPGGFHAFEHRWALTEAFDFFHSLGKTRVQDRIHGLTDHLVEGLAEMSHVNLVTPTDPDLRAGIVTFRVDGASTYEVLGHLDRDGIIASVTPGDLSIPRLTPGLLNSHEEVEYTLESLSEME